MNKNRGVLAMASALATSPFWLAAPAAAADGFEAICGTNAMPPEVQKLTNELLEPGKQINYSNFPPEELKRLMDFSIAEQAKRSKDFPNLCRYRAANRELMASGERVRVVFLGDSITENWGIADPQLFSTGIVNRGISGQTTPQILLRFQQDVIALRPRAVHILAGTNDVYGNTGPSSDEMILDNLQSMVDLAKRHRIKVILGGLTPTGLGMARNARTQAVNLKIRDLARRNRVRFVDYFGPLDDGTGRFRRDLGNDGLHPNRDGYVIMRRIAEEAIRNSVGR
jgi:lysophospholipase L1-like esterase